jgi:SOS response regulatory protein OraA/RecX
MSDINELIERLEKAALVLYQTSQTADSKEEFMEWEAAQALRLLNDENERLKAELRGKKIKIETLRAALEDTCQHEWCDIATGGQYCRLCDARQEDSDDG